MSAQTRYGYTTPIGAAGGIVDLAPYAIDTFLNEEATGTLKFGVGVVRGAKPGSGIALPKGGETADKFEGVTTNNRTTEYDLEGNLSLRKGASVGVMRYGRIYVRVATDGAPVYGDPVYMIADGGDETGYFTNEADGNVAIKGRFISGLDAGSKIAQVELFNQANGAAGAGA